MNSMISQIITQTLTYSLTYGLILYAIYKAPRWLRKLKIKDLPPEIIADLRERQFPSYYRYFNILVTIICLVLFIGGFLIITIQSARLFLLAQITTLGNHAVYFTAYANYIFALVMLFASIFILGALFVLLSRIVPGNFGDYLRSQSIKQWNWGPDEISFAWFLTKIGLVIIVIASPFIILGFQAHTAVYPDNIVVYPFFTFQSQTYRFEDVDRLETTINHYKQDSISTQITLIFKNGQKLDLNPPSPNDQNQNIEMIKNLYQTFRNNNVPVMIAKPLPQEIEFMSGYCPTQQREFYTVLELNQPIINHSGCSDFGNWSI